MNLQTLSDEELLSGVDGVCATTNEFLAHLIAYLAAIETREVHLKAAYCSMFDFCKRRLRLSNGGAYRRLNASRLSMSYPIIIERIRRGEVHLEALLSLRDHLTNDNVVELLDAVANKNSQQVEALVAARFPRPDAPQMLVQLPDVPLASKPLSTSMSPPSTATELLDDAPATSPSADENPAPVRPRRRGSQMKPLSATRHAIQFTIGTEAREDLEDVQDLMRHRNPNGDLELIFNEAIADLRRKLRKERLGMTTRPKAEKAAEVAEVEQEATVPTKPGYVPRATRRAVFERDGEQCTYLDTAGDRCPATTLLEIHHLKSKACGGTEHISNLCVRCRAHNQLDAVQVFGSEHIKRKIDFRRRKSPARANGPQTKQRAARAKKRPSASPPHSQ